jgi:hypothetical protein
VGEAKKGGREGKHKTQEQGSISHHMLIRVASALKRVLNQGIKSQVPESKWALWFKR